ncbi:MAG TPA: hypothetical protein VMX13_07085 [Sedimentisphaerales bacterium]|nr:hypothetical protein [Sedimentisphaerales bacterium]
MGKKAIDIVLLPDEAMTAKVIEANRNLVRQFGAEIVLDKENCLPHISLAMGSLAQTDLPAAADILKDIAGENALPRLEATAIRTSTNSMCRTVSVLEVKNIEQLQSLHEEVMGTLGPYLGGDVTREMLYNPDEIEQSTLRWIESYRDKSSFENFFPHITIGYGELAPMAFPIAFTAGRLALCHLGNHCTCRKILAAAPIATRR